MTTIGLAPGHHSVRVAAHADTAGRTGSVFADVEVPEIARDEVWLSEPVLTSSSAAEMLTSGAPSMLPPLPGPPTTARSFGRGETLAIAAVLLSPTGRPAPVVGVSVHRVDERGEVPITDHTLDRQTDPRGGHYVSFGLPTAALGPGRYVIRLSALPTIPDHLPVARAVEFVVRPS
jgi:hypothetical protein